MSNIKRNILGTIAGFSLIFMNNSNVTKSVNQLFLRINNGENLNSISILVSGIVQDLLLGISLCGICVLLFFTFDMTLSPNFIFSFDDISLAISRL